LTARAAEYLHLDVARCQDVFLDEHTVVAERGLGLAPARGERVRESRLGVDAPHSLAAAAGDRLDEHGKSDGRRFLLQPLRILALAEVSGRHGHAGRDHQRLGRVLQTHRPDRLRRRTHPDESGFQDGGGEGRVLRQEAVAGMNRRRTARFGGRQDLLGAQVALAGRRGPDGDGVVRLPYEGRVGVRRRIHGDGANVQPARRADDAGGDFAPIRNEERVDHGITS